MACDAGAIEQQLTGLRQQPKERSDYEQRIPNLNHLPPRSIGKENKKLGGEPIPFGTEATKLGEGQRSLGQIQEHQDRHSGEACIGGE